MKREANIVLYRGSPQPQDLDRWEGRMRRQGGCKCSVEGRGGAAILSHQIGSGQGKQQIWEVMVMKALKERKSFPPSVSCWKSHKGEVRGVANVNLLN